MLQIGSSANWYACSNITFVFLMCFHKTGDIKRIWSAGLDSGITGNVWWKSHENRIITLPNWFWFFRRSCILRSNASKDFLIAIVHSSYMINLHWYQTLAIAQLFGRLYVGVSFVCIFDDSLSAELNVRLPSNNVAAILDKTCANAISYEWNQCDQIRFSSSTESVQEENPFSSVMRVSYAYFYCRFNSRTFVGTGQSGAVLSNSKSGFGVLEPIWCKI